MTDHYALFAKPGAWDVLNDYLLEIDEQVWSEPLPGKELAPVEVLYLCKAAVFFDLDINSLITEE